jgi:hypothetical protein
MNNIQKHQVVMVRNKILAATDWTVLPDAPLDTAEVELWKEYRQALRDITVGLEEVWDIDNTFWPVPPVYFLMNDGTSAPNAHLAQS